MTARPNFTPAELQSFREQYSLLDQDEDDFLSAKDVKRFLLSAGKPVKIRECKIMIKEIDLLGKGFATFEDFLVLLARVRNGEPTNWSMVLLYSRPFKRKASVFDSITLHTSEFFGVNDPVKQETEVKGFAFFDRIDHKPAEKKQKKKPTEPDTPEEELAEGSQGIMLADLTPQELEAQVNPPRKKSRKMSLNPLTPLRAAVRRVSAGMGLPRHESDDEENEDQQSNITVISKHRKRHLKSTEDVASVRVVKDYDSGAESDSSFEFFSDSEDEESPVREDAAGPSKKRKETHPLSEMNHKGRRLKKRKHQKHKHSKDKSQQPAAPDAPKTSLEGRSSAESFEALEADSGTLIVDPSKKKHHKHHHKSKKSKEPPRQGDMPLHQMPAISEDDLDFFDDDIDVASTVECEELPQRRKIKGRSRARPSPTNSVVYLQDPKVRKFLSRGESRPFFMCLLIIAQFVVLAVAIYKEQGIEELFINPFVGPSAINLVRVGARYVPCMRDPTPSTLGFFNITSPNDTIACPPYYTGPTVGSDELCQYHNVMEFYCGISDFPDGVPNQSWRFLLSILVHMGIIHWVLVFLFQVRFAVNIEREIGTLRTVIIYVISGTLGSMIGTIMSPVGIAGGGSGALMGLFALLFIDIFQNWPLLIHPIRNLLSLILCMLVVFGIGLLPLIDNYSHVGGFVGGLLSGFIFLPTVTFGKRDARKKLALAVISALLLASLFASFLLMFFKGVDGSSCTACQYFECVPVGSPWCHLS